MSILPLLTKVKQELVQRGVFKSTQAGLKNLDLWRRVEGGTVIVNAT